MVFSFLTGSARHGLGSGHSVVSCHGRGVEVKLETRPRSRDVESEGLDLFFFSNRDLLEFIVVRIERDAGQC